MNLRHLKIISLAAGIAVSCAAVALGAEPRAVIELFTSQGCSSCPAADRLMGELAKDPTLVTMSLPIDYWDYLGWKDTLALHGHANRQRAYADTRHDGQVYTPQVVVNGTTHVLGSDRDAIESAVAQTRREMKPLALPVKLVVTDGMMKIDVPAGKAVEAKNEIWLCPMTKKIPVTIERGENKGNTFTYYNVVRGWVKLGEWTGKAETFSVPVSDMLARDADSVAVMVQSGPATAPGMMLGAATASLR